MLEFEHLKTAWKTWRKCPKLFEYLFIEHNPPSDAIEMQFGRTFHAFAETFHNRVDKEKLLKCKTAVETLRVFEPLTVDQPVVKPWVENFKLFEVARWLYCLQRFPKEPLRFWVPKATELTIHFGDLGLIHVDRIQYYDEMALMNCEFKSGKTFDERDLRSELALYNIGINKYGNVGLPCLWIAAYNPQLNLTFLERISLRAVTATWKSIQLFKTVVRSQNPVYKPKPSFFCRWCPCLQECLDNKVFEGE